jgi:hypothetical protein
VPKIVIRRTLSDVVRNHRGKTVYYSVGTCWWGTRTYRSSEHDFPCGPRGELLMMADDVADFIRVAEENPEHYGRHGIVAFEAALDGNTVTDEGRATSFRTWEEYNALIDLEIDKAMGVTRA